MGKLMDLAAILGSDVPFFLTGGAAFVSGRGELVKPVKTPEGLWVILSQPPFSSGTESAFRLLDMARERRTRPESGKNLSRKALIRALEDDPETWPFYNDFLPVFLAGAGRGSSRAAIKTRFYLAILEGLKKAGASFTGLSGSGSCCFGIFTSKIAAERAEKELSRHCRAAGLPPMNPLSLRTARKAVPENFTRLTFFLAQKAKPVLE
jgi:4-diphosphocytidyl-2-C-methyl-D-erythritol kinase